MPAFLGMAVGAVLWLGLAATGITWWVPAASAVAVVLVLVVFRRQVDALCRRWAERRRAR